MIAAPNGPINILNNAKSSRSKHYDHEVDEIQSDASGITVPLSKSLGN